LSTKNFPLKILLKLPMYNLLEIPSYLTGEKLMNQSLIKKLFICLAIGFFFASFSTDVFAGGSISIQWGKGSGSDNREVVKKHKKQGPPAHAPAHGYRAKHQYRYYPSRSVYYDTARGLYFYLKGDNWEVGASLPGSLRVGLGDSVSIELETDKPYIHHEAHVKKYPAKQSKKKKKGKRS
jgi:hypothetical protein